MWRTRRLLALVATFVLLGLSAPILTYYLPDLVKNTGNGIQIIIPEPTPADAIASFASDIAQLGTMVVVVVAAANLSIDAHPILAAFYRTRIRRPALLVLPRLFTVTLAAVGALVAGTVGAWYETVVLLGSVSIGDLVAGFLLETAWLCFVVGVVVLFSSVTRSVLGTVASSLAFILATAFVASVPSVPSTWLPTRLATGVGALVQPNPPGHLWHAVVVACVATTAMVTFAVGRFGRREL